MNMYVMHIRIRIYLRTKLDVSILCCIIHHRPLHATGGEICVRCVGRFETLVNKLWRDGSLAVRFPVQFVKY